MYLNLYIYDCEFIGGQLRSDEVASSAFSLYGWDMN